jgi:hypothetical protein
MAALSRHAILVRGITAAKLLIMSKSYEDIVRNTVLAPDGSVQPSRAQEQAAREGYRALDPEEEQLQKRVEGALSAAGASGVTVEVSRDLVTLMGHVKDVASLQAIEDAVARLEGVETIHNQVVVGN